MKSIRRENYTPRFLSHAEIVSAYFVDTCYNAMYALARTHMDGNPRLSLTDAYRRNITNYIKGIGYKKMYSITVNNLHEYYQNQLGVAITFGDFEHRILEQFIPESYYRDFTEHDKDTALQSIITTTTRKLFTRILEPEILHRIIDHHDNTTNVRMLQDICVNILTIQRDDYYASFARKNMPAARISIDVLEKYKNALIAATKRCCAAEKDRDKAIDLIRQLTNRINELEASKAAAPTTVPPSVVPTASVVPAVPVDTISSYNIATYPAPDNPFTDESDDKSVMEPDASKGSDRLQTIMNDMEDIDDDIGFGTL